ncbi:MAG: hypothetical protein KF819_39445 [Labilithrix sp.]|nr:hypothetical protein [Labilithrix sp.]
MRGHRYLRALLLAAATSFVGCGDKPSAPGVADAALALRTDGGGLAAADAGIDDAAMPQGVSDELSARMRHLLEAISQNNADLAGDIVFPRDAWIASKDAPDPPKSWERKLSHGFRRSVERTHKRTKGIENAKYVGFELGHAIVQVTPRKKDFKKPLWRVKHSKLSFTIDGKPRHIDIAEMTAWRGAWYVTRLR